MRRSHIGLVVLLTAAVMVVAGCSRVGEDWKAAQSADTTEAYQDFLRQHPDSEFGVPAQERVKQLAEDRDWQLAAKADTLDAYQQFVAAHADGKWAQEARVRVENFQLNAGGKGPATAGAPVVAPAVTAAPAAPASKPPAKPPAKSAAKPVGTHLAQLGAFSSKASAESAWHKLSGRFPAQLGPLQPHYQVVRRLHAKLIVRLQISLPTSKQVHELCATLKQQSQACIPVG